MRAAKPGLLSSDSGSPAQLLERGRPTPLHAARNYFMVMHCWSVEAMAQEVASCPHASTRYFQVASRASSDRIGRAWATPEPERRLNQASGNANLGGPITRSHADASLRRCHRGWRLAFLPRKSRQYSKEFVVATRRNKPKRRPFRSAFTMTSLLERSAIAAT
jgi:hypothetical protein